MLCAYAAAIDEQDPLSGLEIGTRDEPLPPPGWTLIDVKATSLNRKDLLALQGVGLRETPRILGSDAAGTDTDGQPVVLHSVIASPTWRGDETLDPKRGSLSTTCDGTFAQRVAVPKDNVIVLPPELRFEDAACLPTAWLTAYRMLFTRSGVSPGGTILVQGAGGGVTTALISLGAAAGLRMWVTSRDEAKLQKAEALGADRTFPTGQRLPERVDAVMESVGKATWGHSLSSLKPGGTVVVCGATSGYVAETELNRIFFLQQRVLGSTMGTRQEFEAMLRFMVKANVRPIIDRVLPLSAARQGFEAMQDEQLFGKVVFTV